MSKNHSKTKRLRGIPPPKGMPFVVQNKLLREDYERVKQKCNKLQRLVWHLINEAGGRIEVDADEYMMLLQGPVEDYGFALVPDAARKKVVFTLIDDKGDPMPPKEKPLIILTDADKPK